MTVSSGIAMEIHYCMGKEAGVDFYKNSDDKCGRCGMKEQNKKGCCSDDHKFYKLDDSHQKAVTEYNINVHDWAVLPTYPPYDDGVVLAGAHNAVTNHSPPSFVPRPARILHGVFRL